MSDGGGGSSTTQNTIDQRFSPLIDYATQAAKGVQESGYTPYTGQRFADLNSTQTAGIDAITNRATNGSPVMDAANSSLISMLGDQTNPYLDTMVNNAQQSVVKNFNGATAGSGSFGNSGLQEELSKGLGDVATNMYGNAYNTNQANKLSALDMAQSYGNQDYTDAAQLMKAGQTVQDQTQQGLDFNYQQFSDQQNLPYKQMAAYSGLLGSSGATGGSTTTQSGGK